MRPASSTKGKQPIKIPLLIFALLASGLVACQPTTVSPTPRKITIAWIPKALDNPIFELGRHGAAQKASELSSKGPVEVEVVYVGPVTADAAEQMRLLDGVISR